MPGGGPPGGGPPGGPPGGRPGGPPGAARTPGRRIPEFVPWTVAAVAIAVAVIVAVTTGGSTKSKSVKPPHAVQIQPLALGNLPPQTANRVLDNGVKLTLNTSGTLAVQVQKVTLQPGASEPWHQHFGSGLAIVVSGTINDYEQVGTGCKLFVLGAGQDRFDPGTNSHSLLNAGKVPAVIMVTGFAPVGKTAALIPKSKPPNCKEAS